jgi:hypothetical protein
MVLAMAVPAFAGQNPNIRAFISFAPTCPDPYVHRTEVCSGLVNCYFVLDNFGPDGGMRQVSMTWTTTGFGMAFAAVYNLPGAQVIGGPDNQTGVGWVVSGDSCVYPNECGIVVVLNQPYFVTGPGTITITPNPVDGTLVTDCDFDADFYCVLANGGLCMDPPAGDCPPPSPVEDSTWGSIKALYR